MTKEIADHGEEFRGEPGAGDEGKDDSAGIHHDRGVRANTARVGASSLLGYLRTRPGVGVAVWATLLQP